MVKWDFENAFRHIPVSPIDTPLLGFAWQGQYYAERFLPFGLRTSPYLFNHFAEVLHWLLGHTLSMNSIQAEIVHYLDDFLIILSPGTNLDACSTIFRQLCTKVGLSIKETKREQGTQASFGGIEVDTVLMVIRLPPQRLLKAQKLVQTAINQNSITLNELQTLTGYLNFVVIATPLRRTFLPCLYNMEIYFPPAGGRVPRRISGEARKDLGWWSKVLVRQPERSIDPRARQALIVWTDAAGTKGLGAFYIDYRPSGEQREKAAHCIKACRVPAPGSAFSTSLPRHILRKREHINTKEIPAVEQALLYWGERWRGTRVIMNIDNHAVVHALENQTIRGASMNVLPRCLLLAMTYDLDIKPRWIPTNENALADALTRFAYDKVTNLAPQLVYPISGLRDRGFLTYTKLESRQ